MVSRLKLSKIKHGKYRNMIYLQWQNNKNTEEMIKLVFWFYKASHFDRIKTNKFIRPKTKFWRKGRQIQIINDNL